MPKAEGCVRRAFLCGQDHYTGKDFEHRRQWLEDKLHYTAKAFAIKLCAYAVMSNHYHVVLHLRPDLSNSWSDLDVVKRWHSLFRGNLLSQRFLANDVLLDAQRKRLNEDIALWRLIRLFFAVQLIRTTRSLFFASSVRPLEKR